MSSEHLVVAERVYVVSVCLPGNLEMELCRPIGMEALLAVVEALMRPDCPGVVLMAVRVAPS